MQTYVYTYHITNFIHIIIHTSTHLLLTFKTTKNDVLILISVLFSLIIR